MPLSILLPIKPLPPASFLHQKSRKFIPYPPIFKFCSPWSHAVIFSVLLPPGDRVVGGGLSIFLFFSLHFSSCLMTKHLGSCSCLLPPGDRRSGLVSSSLAPFPRTCRHFLLQVACHNPPCKNLDKGAWPQKILNKLFHSK